MCALLEEQRPGAERAYDGTNYHGWQAQPNAASVQQQLDRALSLLLRSKIETLGAGRTDAGVHAAYMAAHFDAPEPIDCKQTVFKLNRMLPPDIAVSRIAAVRPEAHARFDALARTYHYYIYTEKNPFRRHYAASLSPSYLNRQPYGFLVQDHSIYLVQQEDAYTDNLDAALDLGIVMLHFSAVASQWAGQVRWELSPAAPDGLPEGLRSAAVYHM